MSRLYYEKAETNKTKQNFSEENERFLIKVILRWIIECLVRGHVAELFCFMSKKFSCRLNQGDRQKRGFKLNAFDLTFLFTTILEKINTL